MKHKDTKTQSPTRDERFNL